ncbi:GerAB/ArcD/ProY family transporter [Tepidibacillus fermentans]|uniref:Spore germination protein KB n=1 Tax=Tepidibacillus fermentans TaxID=1281767 RepID=A0A4R3KJQ2_9BACI|nr:endospore germination permease [Tepidibacillus fermentans]TCS83604.1 spore germination protein KB [Tepidibacillus fermentans]
MLENGVINRLQFGLLVISFTVGSAVLMIPSTVVAKAKQDGWLSILSATILAIGFISIMVTLAKQYPKQTLIEIMETLLGKPIGKVIGLLYAWFFLHLSALVMRNATDFSTTAIMPETPPITFALMAGILIYMVTVQGIEGIGRSNELFTPFMVSGIWFTLFLLFPLIETKRIFPLFAEGIKPILKGAMPVLGFPFAELVVFLMIFPFVNNQKHLKNVWISGVVIGGLTLTLITLGAILVLDVPLTEMAIFPTLKMARLIKIGDFLTRLEAMISLSYLLTLYIKMTLSFYAGVLAFAQVFNLTDYRIIVLPLLIIVISLSIILNKNIIEVSEFATTTWTPYALLFGFMIPLLLLGISFFKQKQQKVRN